MDLSSILLHPRAIPPLHAGEDDPTGYLWSNWTIEPTVALGVLGMAILYVLWTGARNARRPDADDRPISRGQRVAFLAGLLTIFVALGPPLDDWSDHYLLAAHMVQHLLLILLAPPLLLYGTPAWLLQPIVSRLRLKRVGRLLTRPLVAFILTNLVLIAWHVPVLYDAALQREPLHILEHLLYLGTALLAWWPILGALPAWPQLSLPMQCLYLVAMTIPGGIVGSFITLAEPGLYPVYETSPGLFGLGLAEDQQLAGLIMWILPSIIYVVIISVIFFRWASREEAAAGTPSSVMR